MDRCELSGGDKVLPLAEPLLPEEAAAAAAAKREAEKGGGGGAKDGEDVDMPVPGKPPLTSNGFMRALTLFWLAGDVAL